MWKGRGSQYSYKRVMQCYRNNDLFQGSCKQDWVAKDVVTFVVWQKEYAQFYSLKYRNFLHIEMKRTRTATAILCNTNMVRNLVLPVSKSYYKATI